MDEEIRNDETVKIEPLPKPKKSTAKAEIKTTDKTVIYLGPTIKGTILRKMVIFMDGAPEKYADHSIYKHLFIPIDNLDAALAELKRKGSKLNIFYEQAERGDK